MIQLQFSKIATYTWTGRQDQHWYMDCRTVFVDLFGEERTPLITKLFAATSINTSLKGNVRLFRRALWEIDNKKPVGVYLPNIQKALTIVRAGGDLPGRKTNNFAKAMNGDPLAVVVDVWICRAFGLFVESPSPGQYDAIEQWITQEARLMKLEPRELCAMIWSGVRSSGSRERDTKYTTLLRHHLTNLYNCI